MDKWIACYLPHEEYGYDFFHLFVFCFPSNHISWISFELQQVTLNDFNAREWKQNGRTLFSEVSLESVHL